MHERGGIELRVAAACAETRPGQPPQLVVHRGEQPVRGVRVTLCCAMDQLRQADGVIHVAVLSQLRVFTLLHDAAGAAQPR